ncbi:MAG: hypothetical protein JNJ73_20015 [Hyphomonadaceae bacterium]|nr:hypothetical protein [Hyphomonadaceae bacterium]
MRPLLFGIGAIALLVLAAALLFPAQFQSLSSGNIAQLIWLLLAALLVGSGAFGFSRFQGGGNVWLYALFWALAIAGIVAAYQALHPPTLSVSPHEASGVT